MRMLLAKSSVQLTGFIIVLIAVSLLQLGLISVRGWILSKIWWLA